MTGRSAADRPLRQRAFLRLGLTEDRHLLVLHKETVPAGPLVAPITDRLRGYIDGSVEEPRRRLHLHASRDVPKAERVAVAKPWTLGDVRSLSGDDLVDGRSRD